MPTNNHIAVEWAFCGEAREEDSELGRVGVQGPSGSDPWLTAMHSANCLESLAGQCPRNTPKMDPNILENFVYMT